MAVQRKLQVVERRASAWRELDDEWLGKRDFGDFPTHLDHTQSRLSICDPTPADK